MARDLHPALRARTARHGLAVAIALLLPLLALAGALAPGLVEIAEEEVAPAPAPAPVREYTPDAVYRRPMLLPRDFSTGFLSELIEIDTLFLSPTGLHGTDRLAGLLSFQQSGGELIIIDEIEDFLHEALFKDVLLQSFVSDETDGPFDDSIFDTGAPFGPTTGQPYDDFAGGGVSVVDDGPLPVPEPGSCALLALGLLALGVVRGRASSGASRCGISGAAPRSHRQPATS